jgi:hypothetical protein
VGEMLLGGGGRGREEGEGGGRGGGEGRGARGEGPTCVRACVRACTRRLTCPLLPMHNVNGFAPLGPPGDSGAN